MYSLEAHLKVSSSAYFPRRHAILFFLHQIFPLLTVSRSLVREHNTPSGYSTPFFGIWQVFCMEREREGERREEEGVKLEKGLRGCSCDGGTVLAKHCMREEEAAEGFQGRKEEKRMRRTRRHTLSGK